MPAKRCRCRDGPATDSRKLIAAHKPVQLRDRRSTHISRRLFPLFSEPVCGKSRLRCSRHNANQPPVPNAWFQPPRTTKPTLENVKKARATPSHHSPPTQRLKGSRAPHGQRARAGGAQNPAAVRPLVALLFPQGVREERKGEATPACLAAWRR